MRVILDGFTTEWQIIENGLYQGGPESPIFWAIYAIMNHSYPCNCSIKRSIKNIIHWYTCCFRAPTRIVRCQYIACVWLIDFDSVHVKAKSAMFDLWTNLVLSSAVCTVEDCFRKQQMDFNRKKLRNPVSHLRHLAPKRGWNLDWSMATGSTGSFLQGKSSMKSLNASWV